MAVLISDSGAMPLYKNITRIGSDSTADVQVVGDDIFPDHAHILREDDDWVIASLGRGRPIVVNGKKEKRARLREGDTLEFGTSRFTFRLHDTAIADNAPVARAPDIENDIFGYREIVAFSEKLLRSRELGGLLTTLMDKVVEVTRADRGFLVLFEDGVPQIKVGRNIDRHDTGSAIAELSDSIIAKVVREQQPVIVSDAANDAEFKASASVVNLRLLSVMCVPLTEAGELFGLIYLGSNKVVNLFEPHMLEVVTVFAAQASLLIRNAMLLDTLRSDNAHLRQALEDKRFGEIVGTAERMQEVFRKIRKVAPTDVSVLITGETGTGKELIAREIHQRSDRIGKPFIVVNCERSQKTCSKVSCSGTCAALYRSDSDARGPLSSRPQGHALPRRNR